MPLPFDPVEFTILQETGYFGVSPDKLEEIADGIRAGKPLFNAAWDCGIDPANLRPEDTQAIRDCLDEEED